MDCGEAAMHQRANKYKCLGGKINKFVLLGCAEMWNMRELHFNPIIDTKDK